MEKDLLEYIVKALVDEPSAVFVEEREGERGNLLSLRVAPSDVGKIIGKYGRIAKALRTILSATASKTNRRCSLDILD